MFVTGLGRNEQSLWKIFIRCFLLSFGSFSKAVSEEKIFKNRPIRNKNCLWRPCLIMNRDNMSKIHRGSSKDASHQILVHLGKWIQRNLFRNEPTRNKNCLWRPCLLTDQNEMSNIYRGTSNNASYQIAIHLAKRFQRRRFFRNQPIRNNNCLWRPCLLTDQNEMSNLYREPSIDAAYQVSVHLTNWFQTRRFFLIGQSEKELPVADMFVNGSGQNGHSLERTFHRCCIPTFNSFG